MSNLVRHQRIHSGDKPYGCHLCSKRFNQQGNLTKHIKSHEYAHLRWNRSTQDKPYKCSYECCGKSFTAKSNLENHMLTIHHGMSLMQNIPTSSADNFNPEFVPANPGEGYGNMVLAVRASEVPCPVLTKMASRCLHEGCNHVFDNGFELRAHLFAHAPGLEQELRAMREHMLNLMSILQSWDIKSGADQRKMIEYVQCIKAAIIDSITASTRGTSEYCHPTTASSTKKKLIAATSSSSSTSPFTMQSLCEEALSESQNQMTSSSTIDSSEMQESTLITADDESQLFDTILDSDFVNAIDLMDIDAGASSPQHSSSISSSSRTNSRHPQQQSLDLKTDTTTEAIHMASALDTADYVQAPAVLPTRSILHGWMQHLVRVPVSPSSSSSANASSQQEEETDLMMQQEDSKESTSEKDSDKHAEKRSRSSKVLSLRVLRKAFGFNV
jgi:hypothetical protein